MILKLTEYELKQIYFMLYLLYVLVILLLRPWANTSSMNSLYYYEWILAKARSMTSRFIQGVFCYIRRSVFENVCNI